MTSNYINALRRSIGKHLTSTPCGIRCHCSNSWVPISIMWYLGSDTSPVLYSGLKYPTGCLLEMVQDPDGQAMEHNMTSFLTIPCLIPGNIVPLELTPIVL